MSEQTELASMRANVSRVAKQLAEALWALHCASTAIHNAQWRLKRSGVDLVAMADELTRLDVLGRAPWDALVLAKNEAGKLAAVLGVSPKLPEFK